MMKDLSNSGSGVVRPDVDKSMTGGVRDWCLLGYAMTAVTANYGELRATRHPERPRDRRALPLPKWCL